MKISAKGRYALASMTLLAQHTSDGTPMTVLAISEQLGISKLYLEQVFALLRQGNWVTAIKGSRGGYLLAHSPDEISAADILSETENSIFEEAENTVADSAPGIERALQDMLFSPANKAVKNVFERMSLSDLAEESLRTFPEDGYTFCI